MDPVAALAFCAGVLALLAAAELAPPAARWAAGRAPGLAAGLAAPVALLARVGRDGRDPGAPERRRLLAAGALIAGMAGLALGGPVAGLVAGAGGPWAAGRGLRLRRERYRRAVDLAAPAIAVALADALSGGHALRGAIAAAAEGLRGPAGRELARVGAELSLGAPTDEALEAMRRRIGSPNLDTLVAGTLLQRRAGGDLAGLLRACARAFEEQAELDDEVRAATAQARFTGLVVVLLPLGGAGMAELASPGFVRGLAESFLTAWLVGLAVTMQVFAAVAIRRLGRVRG